MSNIDRQGEIDELASRLGLVQTTHLVGDLDATLQRLDANVNTRLLAEVLLLDWPRA